MTSMNLLLLSYRQKTFRRPSLDWQPSIRNIFEEQINDFLEFLRNIYLRTKTNMQYFFKSIFLRIVKTTLISNHVFSIIQLNPSSAHICINLPNTYVCIFYLYTSKCEGVLLESLQLKTSRSHSNVTIYCPFFLCQFVFIILVGYIFGKSIHSSKKINKQLASQSSRI